MDQQVGKGAGKKRVGGEKEMEERMPATQALGYRLQISSVQSSCPFILLAVHPRNFQKQLAAKSHVSRFQAWRPDLATGTWL